MRSGDKMKDLGFHLDSRPTVHAHIDALVIRMRDTAWVLRHLKIAGFTEAELATVYTTVVRPVLDYCAVIYHPMLTDEKDQVVERLQVRALKNIYGYKDSYAQMREKAWDCLDAGICWSLGGSWTPDPGGLLDEE